MSSELLCERVVLIHLQALKVRQADVTRETVQKSVCVLSRVVRKKLALVLETLSWFFAHPVRPAASLRTPPGKAAAHHSRLL